MSSKVEKKILDAAMEVVAEKKISGTRMHMIAEQAQMSQASLHYHFSTKNELMMALLDNLQESFTIDRKNYIDLENKNTDENITGFFEQKKNEILNKKKYDYAQLDYWVQGTTNEEIRDKFRDTFNTWRNGISEAIGKNHNMSPGKSKDLSMIPYVMVSLMMGASLQYLIDEGSFDLDEYFKISESIINDLRSGKIHL